VFNPITAIKNFFAASSTAGYDQALNSRTNVDRPVGAGADFSLEHQEHRLRLLEKARLLERDTALASAMLDRMTELVVGRGIKPQARTDDDAWNEKAEELFLDWAEAPEARQLYNFWEAQRLMVRGYYRDGDVFALKLKSGLFQLLEADRVHAPLGKEFFPNHVAGIDLDPETNRPVKYYVVPIGPNEHYIVRPYDYPQRIEVLAEDMLMWARRQRPTQTRGLSVFATNISWFAHLDKFVEATVIGARMAACLGILIETPIPYAPTPGVKNIAGGTSPRFDFEPGMVKTLMPGEKAMTLKPEQPSKQFAEFMSTVQRIIGLPAGLPLEVLSMDFSKSNYSSSRGAFMLAFKAARVKQDQFCSSVLKPIWHWKIEGFIREGLLEDNEQKRRHEWIPPANGWIDPTKEVESTLMALDAGLTTHSQVATELGHDFDDLVRTRAREDKLLAKAGLKFAHSNKTREEGTDALPEDEPAVPEDDDGTEED